MTLGSEEIADVSFAPLAAAGPRLSVEHPRVRYALIDGADHAYTDRSAPLWTSVATFLSQMHI